MSSMAAPMAGSAPSAAAPPENEGNGSARRCDAARGMAMGAPAKPDLNDVTYDAFLANDRTLGDPDVVKVETGGRVLLRVINSSSMSAFHVDLGQLDGELIAVDGFRVAPVVARRFPIAVAQRLDIRLAIPRAPAAHPVLRGARRREQANRHRLAGGACAGRAHLGYRRHGFAGARPRPREPPARLKPLKPRRADRVHTLDLTGEMAGYVWSINNVVWNKDVRAATAREGRAGRS